MLYFSIILKFLFFIGLVIAIIFAVLKNNFHKQSLKGVKRKKKRYEKLCTIGFAISLTFLFAIVILNFAVMGLEPSWNYRNEPKSYAGNDFFQTGDSDETLDREKENGYSQDDEDYALDKENVFSFSELHILGDYDFGKKITSEDLKNFDIMYKEYWEKSIPWEPENLLDNYDSEAIVRERVDSFDQKKLNNKELLSANEYMLNAYDRIYMYEKYGNIRMIEQAGISAEGAVEVEEVQEEGIYGNIYRDILLTVNCFCYVLRQRVEQYDSGTDGDLKYRIGKVMYKPYVNLERLNKEEKYYSLCCSHIFLKDAFESCNDSSQYLIETAYYYVVNCKDLITNMNLEDISEVAEECSYAYTLFIKSGTQKPDNPTYLKYKEEARKAFEYIEYLKAEQRKDIYPVK